MAFFHKRPGNGSYQNINDAKTSGPDFADHPATSASQWNPAPPPPPTAFAPPPPPRPSAGSVVSFSDSLQPPSSLPRTSARPQRPRHELATTSHDVAASSAAHHKRNSSGQGLDTSAIELSLTSNSNPLAGFQASTTGDDEVVDPKAGLLGRDQQRSHQPPNSRQSSGRLDPALSGSFPSRLPAMMRSETKKRPPEDFDEDAQETFMERVMAMPVVVKANRAIDRVMMSQPFAICVDVVDVCLFILDIYTDIKLIRAFADSGETGFQVATLIYFSLHYVLMAMLMCWFVKRTSSIRWNAFGLIDEEYRQPGNLLWLGFIPFSIPSVIVLDVAMLFISVMPLIMRGSTFFSGVSSFLSNYKFSRFFIKFWFKSIPQAITQAVFYAQLRRKSSSADQALLRSIAVNAINVVKYGFFLWKAADDAGMPLSEYWKYLLLLKGNYDCAPAAMSAMIAECCRLQQNTFTMNGFALHRDKARYGPAQQSYILLNSFERFERRAPLVRHWVVSGCPVASINRIVEKGVKVFKRLETLEIRECALRGDPSFLLFTRALKRHQCLGKVKLIQTGVLKKYRNQMVDKAARGLVKPGLGLRQLALCVFWWDEEVMQDAAKLLRGHPTLELLALEFPDLSGSAGGGAEQEDDDALGEPLSPVQRANSQVVSNPSAHGDSSNDGKGGSSHTLSVKYGWAVVSVLHAVPLLHSLHLHHHRFGQDSMGVVAKALAANTGLTFLSLRGSKVGDTGAVALSKALAANTALRTLVLQRCQLHAEGITALGGALAHNHSLTSLDVSVNRVHGEGLRDLAAGLRFNSSLRTLKIEGWTEGFDDEQALAALAGALTSNRSLTHLSLARSEVRDRGAMVLAQGLAANGALEVLDLGCGDKAATVNRIQDAGLDAVCRALAGHATLTDLNLQGSIMGERSCASLCNLVGINRSLASLNVARCGLSDEHVTGLAHALLEAADGGAGLRSLNISQVSGMELRGMQALAVVLTNADCALESLDLSFLSLAARDDVHQLVAWAALAEGIAAAQRLTHLDVSHCSPSASAVEALAAALARNNTLTSLRICGMDEAVARLAFEGVSGANRRLTSLMATSEPHGPVNILEHTGPDETWSVVPPSEDTPLLGAADADPSLGGAPNQDHDADIEEALAHTRLLGAMSQGRTYSRS